MDDPARRWFEVLLSVMKNGILTGSNRRRDA
jgi:hypothetical protein